MISFLLIGVATYGKTSNMITSLQTVGGIVASGVFLLFIAVVGLYGAIKHHQVIYQHFKNATENKIFMNENNVNLSGKVLKPKVLKAKNNCN